MTQKINAADLPEFDLAEMLKTEQDIATYLTLVIEEGDVSALSHALGIAARARGMTEIAKASGLSREALYKALRPDASPRFDTISRVCRALGVRLVAQAVEQESQARGLHSASREDAIAPRGVGRGEQVGVRLKATERQALAEAARAQGTSPANWIRSLALAH